MSVHNYSCNRCGRIAAVLMPDPTGGVVPPGAGWTLSLVNSTDLLADPTEANVGPTRPWVPMLMCDVCSRAHIAFLITYADRDVVGDDR